MDSTLAVIIKSTALIFTGGLFYYKYRQVSNKQKELEFFKNAELKGVESLDKLQEGESMYIKAKIKKDSRSQNTKEIIKNPLHYNEYYLEEPSNVMVIKKLQKYQNSLAYSKSFYTLSDPSGKQIKVKGIKKIVGDVYSISKTVERIQFGFLKKVWGAICYFIESFFDIVRKQQYQHTTKTHIPQVRKPFILGPVIGVLHYSVGLLTDSFFVLKVKFQNGLHRIEVLAESKNALLGKYELQLFGARLQSLLFGLIAMLFSYLLYKNLKNWSKMQNIVRPFDKGRKNLLQIENVSQEKACIICFTNCRNLVLFDCKHLIMCWDCFRTAKQDNCPICKKQILEAKVIEANQKEEVLWLKEKNIMSDVSSQQQKA